MNSNILSSINTAAFYSVKVFCPHKNNISSESINIINHLVSTFNDGFQAAKRGTSSTHVLQSSKTSVGDAKAPITVLNETGHDVTFTPCANWHELDFVDSRHSLRSFTRVHPSDGSDLKNVNFCMRTFSISNCFSQLCTEGY